MLSATLSNYEPMTRLGFQYELFYARMSANRISYNGNQDVGDPHLSGAQISIEPFSGWSLGVNRLLQYGGGAGLPSSPRFLLRDFFQPSGLSQTKANQRASLHQPLHRPGQKHRSRCTSSMPARTNSGRPGGSYLPGKSGRVRRH